VRIRLARVRSSLLSKIRSMLWRLEQPETPKTTCRGDEVRSKGDGSKERAYLRCKDAGVNTGLKEYFKRGLLVHVAAVENARDAADLELKHGS
jgi:hypothetical protein